MDSLNPAELSYVPTTGVHRLHETPVRRRDGSQHQGLRP